MSVLFEGQGIKYDDERCGRDTNLSNNADSRQTVSFFKSVCLLSDLHYRSHHAVQHAVLPADHILRLSCIRTR